MTTERGHHNINKAKRKERIVSLGSKDATLGSDDAGQNAFN